MNSLKINENVIIKIIVSVFLFFPISSTLNAKIIKRETNYSENNVNDSTIKKQKPNKTDTTSIYISESKYSITDYNDSLLSQSTIIIYHRAKPFEGDYFYEVFINDSIVYDAVWGTADTIKVESQKVTSICAISVTGECIDIIPGRGKIFFISCGLKKGRVRGKPLLEFIEPAIAEKELKKISK